jgi:hypothetical protein
VSSTTIEYIYFFTFLASGCKSVVNMLDPREFSFFFRFFLVLSFFFFFFFLTINYSIGIKMVKFLKHGTLKYNMQFIINVKLK